MALFFEMKNVGEQQNSYEYTASPALKQVLSWR